MIVEDSKLLRNGMVYTLDWQSMDCQVVGQAGDGLEGITVIRRTDPDIVVTDIRMPGLNGLEMVEMAAAEGCRAAVVIISGYDDFAYAKSALRLGAVEYLVKPLEDEDTYRALRAACAKVNQRRKMESLQQRLETVESSKMIVFKDYLDTETDLKSEYTQQAIDHIKEHFAEDISVRSIAEALSISESHLSKVFKDTMQTTIGEYLLHFRIKEACRMLQDPGNRVYEVAGRVGYGDQRYFSVLFKRVMGMTPNEFRTRSAAR